MPDGTFDIVEPIRQKSLPEEVADRIYQLIRSRPVSSSAQLPSTRDLAKKLAVSVPVVREALARLHQAGIIDVVHGSGIFIRDDIGDLIKLELKDLTFIEFDELIKLLELRRGIESEAARLAALRRTEQHLAQMNASLEELAQDVAAGRLGDESDYRFHRAVAEATANQVFNRISNLVESQFRHGIKISRQKSLSVPGRPQAVLAEHQAVFRAILAQDPAEAYNAMRSHVQAAMDRLIGRP